MHACVVACLQQALSTKISKEIRRMLGKGQLEDRDPIYDPTLKHETTCKVNSTKSSCSPLCHVGQIRRDKQRENGWF